MKSKVSDELINTYVLRPVAGVLVRGLSRTRVTPNQVTLAATASGLCAAVLYFQGTPGLTAAAGAMITLKDLLDSADGQLARAKQMFSRSGRFLDSIGDFVVNAAVFAAIAAAMIRAGAWEGTALLALAAFLGISLRVSYHVFYHTSYLHLEDAYGGNRVSEELTPEDRDEDRMTAALHRTFLVLYGWQDRLVAALDRVTREPRLLRFARNDNATRNDGARITDEAWYGDRTGVRLSGFLGLGTEMFLLTACSLFDRLDIYFAANIAGMNLIWLACLVYRGAVLRRSGGRAGRDVIPSGRRS